ncbi:hypothetical protein KS664_003211 [Clostridium perfringens]|nr:hypothetical protein [Clostridium perfringens]
MRNALKLNKMNYIGVLVPVQKYMSNNFSNSSEGAADRSTLLSFYHC